MFGRSSPETKTRQIQAKVHNVSCKSSWCQKWQLLQRLLVSYGDHTLQHTRVIILDALQGAGKGAVMCSKFNS